MAISVCGATPAPAKSTLLGFLVQQLRHQLPTNLAMISHFVGASARASSTLDTVRRISHELITLSGVDPALPEDLDELTLRVPRHAQQSMRGN